MQMTCISKTLAGMPNESPIRVTLNFTDHKSASVLLTMDRGRDNYVVGDTYEILLPE